MVKYTIIKFTCQICDKTSKQKSHHDTHLDSEHHKDKMEILKLKLEKQSKKHLIKTFGYDEIDKILDIMSGVEPKYELKLQKKSNKLIYQFTEEELIENKKYEEFKNKFKSKLKSWHNTLSGAGVTGDPALDDIINIIMLCYLDKKVSDKGQFDLLNLESYPITKRNRLSKYLECLSIDHMIKNYNILCKSKNNLDGKSILEKTGELLLNHRNTSKFIKDSDFINCKKNSILKDLIKDIQTFCEKYHIFEYSDIVGIAYEFWMNEYRGGGGKELGNFFTERRLMRMCFEMIDKKDIKRLKINNDSTIGDEFCGTFGFPLYLKSFLKDKFKIDIKNENIYGVEFEDRASRMAILNAMFSLDNVENVVRGDSFITNISPHLDISVHNVPFGGRMKYKNIKRHYEEYKINHPDIPGFDEIIKSKANQDATLASQMVLYKTNKMGICIIKDGQEATGTTKELVAYRKFLCDSVNIKKILKIPSGAFSSTGTKTLCFYFVKDGNKTENIQFLELDSDGHKIIELCNVKYEDLENNNYLWSPYTYLEDEEMLKLQEKANCEWKKLGDICDFKRGERITKKEHIDNGKYYVIGGGDETKNFKTNKFNRSGFNCRIARYGGSEKNFIKITNFDYWLHDNAFTLQVKNKDLNIKYISYYLLNYIKNNYYYKKLNNSVPPALDFDGFTKLKIPIPSLEIQEETVNKIELFDGLIKSMEDLNKKHKEGMKIYMEIMLKKYIDEIEWKKLGDVCEIKIGGTPSRNKEEYWEGNNLWVSVRELNNNIINDTKEKISDLGVNKSNVKLIPKDTILMSFKLSIGKMGITGKDLYTNEAIAGLITNKLIDKKYLYYYLQNNLIINNNDGAMGNGSLNISKLKIIKIPVPSLETQNKTVEQLNFIDQIISENNNMIKNYKQNIKDILIQSY
ncbi:putative DNA N6-adenine methyltransferase [Cafeteria roenbergensis virus]|uniref:Putative DNA N6-adenine methyltransferase n=1 Tax=Cafeteria roenbergensis virus (strain BV-PW1) TaxID=693272 RepID=E3T4D5_CROVB|nr:putative DNA N6-adenine methyltransferase [Cafeteria roenbergensis virus BV-PW1]ADO67048.1 putative DNA N6-adenine methyltransferase [Cafeteria roenbergensis virus BV-PW1]